MSIELMALSLLLSLSLAVPAGLLAAYRAGQSIDKLLSALAALLLSAPSFMLGLVLMFFLALTLKWLPAVGYVPLSEGILGNLRSFAIPVLTLALVEWPVFMRILRSDAIVTLQQDYVLLAKAKGLRNAHILFRHVLKPSSFTLITVAGLTIGTLIGGALVVETICASWRRPLVDRLDKQSGDRLVEPISQEALMRAAHIAVGAGQGRRARPESDRGICSACARLSQDEAVRAGARGPQRGANPTCADSGRVEANQ